MAPNDTLAAATEAIMELRRLVVEGHQAVKDLRQVIKEYKALAHDTDVEKMVSEHIAAEVKKGLDNFENTLIHHVRKTEAAIQTKVEQHANTVMFGNPHPGPDEPSMFVLLDFLANGGDMQAFREKYGNALKRAHRP